MEQHFDENVLGAQALQMIPSGIGVYDVTGSVVRKIYLNDGYYQMISADREGRHQYDGTNTTLAILPEDRPAILREAQLCVQEKRMFRCRFRVQDGEGNARWIAIRANHIPLGGGTERFFAAYYDVDELVRTQEQLRANELLFSETLKYSGTTHFIYYPRLHRYEAVALPEKYKNLPTAMDDFPESYIRYVSMPQEDAANYRAMLQRIDSGAAEAECTVRMMYLGQHSWYRVRCQSIFGADGRVEKAIGSAAVINHFLETEKIFRDEKLRVNSMQSGFLAVTCVNVTKDQNIEISDNADLNCKASSGTNILADAVAADPAVVRQNPETLRVLLAAAEQIPDPDERRRFLATCSHAGMLRLYEGGRREVTLEYRRRTGRGLIWVSTRISLMPDPDSGDVLAFFFTSDINEHMIYRKITGQIIEKNLETVSYCDIGTKTIYLQDPARGGTPLFHPYPYEASIVRAMEQYVQPEERESVRAQFGLENIFAQLEKAEVCTIFYTGLQRDESLPGHPFKRMKSDIFYLDGSRDILVFLQTNATGIFEEERGRREKEAEALRVREQARALSAVISNIPAGIAVYRRDAAGTHVLMMNDRLDRLAGASREKIMSVDFERTIENGVHPDDLENVRESMKKLFAAEGPVSFTYRTKTDAGDFVWISAAGQAVAEKDGSRTAYVLYTDATAQKEREAEFDNRISELSSANPNTIGVFHLDLTANRLVRIQHRSTGALGLKATDTADEFFRKCLCGMCYECDRRACAEQIDRLKLLKAFAAGRSDMSCDFRVLESAGGEVRWATSYFYTVKNPRTGSVETIVCTVDSTEEIRSRRIMQCIAEEDYDFFSLLDVRRRTVRFVSIREKDRATAPTHAADYDEDVRSSMEQLLGPEEGRRCVQGMLLDTILKELEQKSSYIFPYTIRLPDGSVLKKQMRYEWLDDTKDFILSTRVDITAAYLQEQEQLRRMAQALRAAESANQAKTQFLSRISHDIRTPLSAITSMTAFAREDAADPEKLNADLDRIESSGQFLLSLINDILDISRIDSGNIELHPEPYPYGDYIANVRNIFEPLCQKKGIALVFPPAEHSGTAVADKVRMNQIVLNLVSNAVRYTPPGGTVAVTAGSEDIGDRQLSAFLEVKDTGIGMSRAFQKVMFEPFTQEYSNPLRPADAGGTGLGLSLVKRIVDFMNGSIEVKSEPGRGTDISVHFTFPKAAGPDRPAGKSAMPQTKLNGTVLLAEDNAINTEIAVRLLGSFGLETETAVNGREAAERFANSVPGRYAAVLLDIQMPLMNGYEAARAIRAMPRPDAKTVPILAMTADAFADDVRRCLEAGMNGHIPKPIDPRKLRDTLEKFLSPESGR